MAADDLPVPAGFSPACFSPGFLDVAGPYFLKRDGDATIIGCRIVAQHMNYHAVAHGGVLATLADVALSFQIYDSADPKLPVSTIGLTTNFLSAARLGDWVEASATIDRIGTRIAYVHGSISTGDRMLMTMSGVYHVTRPQ